MNFTWTYKVCPSPHLATSSGIFEHSWHWVNSYDTIDKVPVYSKRESNLYPPIGKRGIELTFQPVNHHGYTPTGIFIYVSTARWGGTGRGIFIVRPSLCEYHEAYFWSFREWGGDVAVTRHTMVCRSRTIGYSSWAIKGRYMNFTWTYKVCPSPHFGYVIGHFFELSRHWVNRYDTI